MRGPKQDLSWMGELFPEVEERLRGAVVDEAFDWLKTHPQGQIVIACMLRELGYFQPIEGPEGIPARNLCLWLLKHLGHDNYGPVLRALATGKE